MMVETQNKKRVALLATIVLRAGNRETVSAFVNHLVRQFDAAAPDGISRFAGALSCEAAQLTPAAVAAQFQAHITPAPPFLGISYGMRSGGQTDLTFERGGVTAALHWRQDDKTWDFHLRGPANQLEDLAAPLNGSPAWSSTANGSLLPLSEAVDAAEADAIAWDSKQRHG